jgi:hypothetical protein
MSGGGRTLLGRTRRRTRRWQPTAMSRSARWTRRPVGEPADRRLCKTFRAMRLLPLPIPRRHVLAGLAAAAAGVAAGCQDSADPRPAPSGPASSPAPVDPLQVELAAERRIAASYAATIRRHPSLAARLTPFGADHTAHVAALERALGIAPAPTPTPTGTAAGGAGSATPTATPSGSAPPGPDDAPPVPGTPAAAVAALRTAERSAARTRAAACLDARTDRAALLASIAACEASHAELLR